MTRTPRFTTRQEVADWLAFLTDRRLITASHRDKLLAMDASSRRANRAEARATFVYLAQTHPKEYREFRSNRRLTQ